MSDASRTNRRQIRTLAVLLAIYAVISGLLTALLAWALATGGLERGWIVLPVLLIVFMSTAYRAYEYVTLSPQRLQTTYTNLSLGFGR